MSIENVIEKLNCATRCHPNAVPVLVSEAIEMLQAVDAEQKIDIKQLISDFENMPDDGSFESPHPIFQMACEIDGLRSRVKNLVSQLEEEKRMFDRAIRELTEITELCGGDEDEGATAIDCVKTLIAEQINIIDLGMNQPASMRRCVEKLIEAAEILLDDKNYDGTGHELISDARSNAIKYLAEYKPYKQPPKEWLQAVEEFVRRCEAGEIQSKYTYKKFKALLEESKS